MTEAISDSAIVDSTSPQVFSLIVAAGKGSRFGSDIPKQYTPVNGKTILQQSVTALAASSYIKQLLLVIAKDDSFAKGSDFDLPVTFTHGSAERWQSVQEKLG